MQLCFNRIRLLNRPLGSFQDNSHGFLLLTGSCSCVVFSAELRAHTYAVCCGLSNVRCYCRGKSVKKKTQLRKITQEVTRSYQNLLVKLSSSPGNEPDRSTKSVP